MRITLNKKEKWILTGGLFIIIFVCFFIKETGMDKQEDSLSITSPSQGKEFVFVCKNGKAIDATFYPTDDTKVDLLLSDGRSMALPHATSASGARYANADESIVFWNKGNTAFITESNKTTFLDCALTNDYKKTAYLIDGKPVVLGTNGTKFFGNEVTADFDGNGSKDVALIFTQNSGGSGTFYYVAVALLDENGNYRGTNAILLGDRIAPQPITANTDGFTANYADRAANESMVTKPHIGKSLSLTIMDGKLQVK